TAPRRRRAGRRPGAIRRGSSPSLGILLLRRLLLLGRSGLELRRLGRRGVLGGGGGFGRRAGLRFLPRALPVLAVVGDVEARALEDEPRPPGYDAHGGAAALRTLGPRPVGHLLESFELVPLGAAVLVGGHIRPSS